MLSCMLKWSRMRACKDTQLEGRYMLDPTQTVQGSAKLSRSVQEKQPSWEHFLIDSVV